MRLLWGDFEIPVSEDVDKTCFYGTSDGICSLDYEFDYLKHLLFVCSSSIFMTGYWKIFS